MGLKYWILTIVAGAVSGIIASFFYNLVYNAYRNKRTKAYFKKDISALLHELEGNLKGRGNEQFPFQTSLLEKILDSNIFKKNYPDLHEQATKCYVISGAKLGRRPAEGQAAMRALKESIEKEIPNL